MSEQASQPQEICHLSDGPFSHLSNRELWQEDVRRRHPFEVGGTAIQPALRIENIPNPLIQFESLQLLLNESSDERTIAGLNNEVREIEKDAEMLMQVYPGDEQAIIAEAYATFLNNNPTRTSMLQGRDTSETDQTLEASWADFNSLYEAGIKNGSTLGYLPEDYLTRYQKSVPRTIVRAVDPIVDKVLCYSGMYDNVKDEIVIFSVDKDNSDILGHEFGHKESGGSFVSQPDGSIVRTRVGFSNDLRPGTPAGLEEIIDTGRYTHGAWTEATNQHINAGILTGDFETLDPEKRTDDMSSYNGFRRVLASLYEKAVPPNGERVLQVRTLTNAVTEDTVKNPTLAGSFTYRKQLVRQMVDTYGWGSIKAAEKLMMHTNVVGESDVAIELIARCIIPPQFNDKGEISEKGHIDLTLLPSSKEIDEKALELIRAGQDDNN